jgi:hypothetical protein
MAIPDTPSAQLFHRLLGPAIPCSVQSGSADDDGLAGFGCRDRPHPDAHVLLADVGDETPLGVNARPRGTRGCALAVGVARAISGPPVPTLIAEMAITN